MKAKFRHSLNLQLFAEKPEEPEDPNKDQEPGVDLDLEPSKDDPATTIKDAAETAAAAMADVKRIELDALTAVTETLRTLLDEVRVVLGEGRLLVEQVQTALTEAEDYRQEALDIAEALKQPSNDETGSDEKDTTVSDPLSDPTKDIRIMPTGGLMKELRKIL